MMSYQEQCRSERSAEGVESSNRRRLERAAGPSIGTMAIPRLRRYAPALGMTDARRQTHLAS